MDQVSEKLCLKIVVTVWNVPFFCAGQFLFGHYPQKFNWMQFGSFRSWIFFSPIFKGKKKIQNPRAVNFREFFCGKLLPYIYVENLL